MLADFCKHRFLLSLSPAIPTPCGGVHKMKVTTQPVPLRPERAEAPSPGHRPGLLQTQTCRPERAKALKYWAMYKAFALTGRLADCHYTQGGCPGLGAFGPSART